MGVKGDKNSSIGQLAIDMLVSKLVLFNKISVKKMFGGHGVFHDGKMFAIVNSKGVVHFKTDDSSYKKYEDYGSEKHGRMPYHSVPEKILEDLNELVEWAEEAIKLSKK